MYTKSLLAIAAALVSTGAAQAADWSDTSLGVRYGTAFAEPYANKADGSRQDIKKTIVSFTHVSGYKYGSNFFNADALFSDRNNPGDGIAGNSGAQEVYIVYRHLLDFGKVTGATYKFGPIRGLGLTAGFDLNTKNDGYGSKKRMLVIGPTMMFDVPGFWNLSALAFFESNSPTGLPSRYTYDTHGALATEWGVGVGSLPLTFKGYALYIASKGKNEFGGATKPETHVDMSLMLDAGAVAGGPKSTFMVGVAYEYWRNKFGNPTTSAAAGPGATARTPMIRAEYHF